MSGTRNVTLLASFFDSREREPLMVGGGVTPLPPSSNGMHVATISTICGPPALSWGRYISSCKACYLVYDANNCTGCNSDLTTSHRHGRHMLRLLVVLVLGGVSGGSTSMTGMHTVWAVFFLELFLPFFPVPHPVTAAAHHFGGGTLWCAVWCAIWCDGMGLDVLSSPATSAIFS